jgi:hypothetical protein
VSGCEFCARAAVQLDHSFHAHCRGCQARMVARSQLYFQCAQAGEASEEYREFRRKAGVTHAEVQAAAAADVLMKGER